MFLKSDNSINWKRMAIAGVVVAVVCVAGVLWFDRPVFTFLRGFNWVGWDVMDVVFATKIWLAVSVITAIVWFIISGKNSLLPSPRRTTGPSSKKLKGFDSWVPAFAGMTVWAKTNPAFMVFCSVAGASIVAGILKVLLGRMRPFFYEMFGVGGFFPIKFDSLFNSMPSGHTTASFAGLVMIGLMFPKIKWATWSLAIIVAVSRVCVGAHWPADVILGAFIGMCAADIVYAKLRK